jgi:antitoxin component HigA of HigAB toxin-antitoxin module
MAGTITITIPDEVEARIDVAWRAVYGWPDDEPLIPLLRNTLAQIVADTTCAWEQQQYINAIPTPDPLELP